MDGELAAGLAEDAAEARVEVQPVGGEVELALGDIHAFGAAAVWSVVMGGTVLDCEGGSPPGLGESSSGRPHGDASTGPARGVPGRPCVA